MCGFLKDKSPPPPPQLPQQGPKIEFKDVTDLISRVEMVKVNRNGKESHELRSLPNLPHEEVLQNIATQMMQDLIQNLNYMSKTNPTALVDYQPVLNGLINLDTQRQQQLAQYANLGNIQQDIQNYKDVQKANLNREFAAVNQQADRALAQSRMGRSSDAIEIRNSLANQQAIANQQLEVDSTLYGEDLSDQRLNRNSNLYGLSESGRQAQKETLLQGYGMQQQEQDDKRNLAADDMELYGFGNQIMQQNFQNKMSSPAAGLRQQIYGAETADDSARYNARINRDTAQYNMDLQAYKSRPTSFKDVALRYIGSNISSGVKTMGSYLGGNTGTQSRYGRRRF